MPALTPENAQAAMRKYGGIQSQPVRDMRSGVRIGIYGPGGCIDGGSFVQYQIRYADGTRANHKGGTIERLFERFHKLSRSGKGYYARPTTAQCEFYAPSVDEDGRIVQNRVLDVCRTGEKECYRLTTTNGYNIVATAAHRFYDGNKFVALHALTIGMPIALHTGTMEKSVGAPHVERKTFYVKAHPFAPMKYVDRYAYRALVRSRAVVEANMNSMPLDAYIQRLNADKLDGLQFLSPNIEVHHSDEDALNDTLDNLQCLDKASHAHLHMQVRGGVAARYVTTQDAIASIEPVGIRTTYDLVMAPPFNNYVANKIVVHNSGKTTLAASITKSVFGAPAAYLDARGNPEVVRSYGDAIQVFPISKFDQVDDWRTDFVNDRNRPFKSVIVDNLCELHAMDLRDRYGTDAEIAWTMHSAATADVLQLARNFTDLSTIYGVNVIFVMWDVHETRNVRGREVNRSELSFNKALQSQLPGIISWLGRLYIVDDAPPWTRMLDFRPIESMHVAKFQVDPDDPVTGEVPMQQWNPSLASIVDTVLGGIPWPTALHAEPSNEVIIRSRK